MSLRAIMQTAILGSTLFIANQHQALAQNIKPQTKESPASQILETPSNNTAIGIASSVAGGLLAAYIGYRKGKKDGIALAKEEYNRNLTRLQKTVDAQHEQAMGMVDELEEKRRKKKKTA